MLEEFEMSSLMSRPDLPRIAENINAKLRDEDARRKKFRHELTPSVKAEFIAGEVVMHSPFKAKHLRATEKLVRLLATFAEVRQLGECLHREGVDLPDPQ